MKWCKPRRVWRDAATILTLDEVDAELDRVEAELVETSIDYNWIETIVVPVVTAALVSVSLTAAADPDGNGWHLLAQFGLILAVGVSLVVVNLRRHQAHKNALGVKAEHLKRRVTLRRSSTARPAPTSGQRNSRLAGVVLVWAGLTRVLSP